MSNVRSKFTFNSRNISVDGASMWNRYHLKQRNESAKAKLSKLRVKRSRNTRQNKVDRVVNSAPVSAGSVKKNTEILALAEILALGEKLVASNYCVDDYSSVPMHILANGSYFERR